MMQADIPSNPGLSLACKHACCVRVYQYPLQTRICLDLEGCSLMHTRFLRYWNKEDHLWQHLQAPVHIWMCSAAACQPCSPVPRHCGRLCQPQPFSLAPREHAGAPQVHPTGYLTGGNVGPNANFNPGGREMFSHPLNFRLKNRDFSSPLEHNTDGFSTP